MKTRKNPKPKSATRPAAFTPEHRFVFLVQAYLNGDALAVEVDPVEVLDCALAVSPGVVPPLARMAELARDFVNAIACDEADGLPRELKRHVEKWGMGKEVWADENAPVI